jgi:hypothetical protein
MIRVNTVDKRNNYLFRKVQINHSEHKSWEAVLYN